MSMRTFVEARGIVLGFHYWPEAPEEVAFLRARHRHRFHWRVKVEVLHDDRQVEFVLLKRDVDRVFKLFPTSELGFDFATRSCEQIARMICETLINDGYRIHDVGVSEDGEFEGTVYAGGSAP